MRVEGESELDAAKLDECEFALAFSVQAETFAQTFALWGAKIPFTSLDRADLQAEPGFWHPHPTGSRSRRSQRGD
jgi:hypothetical protein